MYREMNKQKSSTKKFKQKKDKRDKQKLSANYDKPIPKPKTKLEDKISLHRGMSRENEGVNFIL